MSGLIEEQAVIKQMLPHLWLMLEKANSYPCFFRPLNG